MRILVYALILMSLCGLQVKAHEIDPDTQVKVLAANDEAIKVMRIYAQNPACDENNRQIASRMADLLEDAGIIPAVGVVRDFCQMHPGVIADTGWISQIISLCDRGLMADKNKLVQAFIHEAYHLYEGKFYIPKYHPDIYERVLADPRYDVGPRISEESETRAATIEYDIMKNTYKCFFMDTKYFTSLLNKKKNTDYFMCK